MILELESTEQVQAFHEVLQKQSLANAQVFINPMSERADFTEQLMIFRHYYNIKLRNSYLMYEQQCCHFNLFKTKSGLFCNRSVYFFDLVYSLFSGLFLVFFKMFYARYQLCSL